MSSSEVALTAAAGAERKLGATMMRWSAGLAAVPDPIPLADEILFASVFAIGAGLYAFQPVTGALSNFGNSAETSQSQPLTSTTGHSRRGNGKKQMSSTSSSYSRRRNYYYTKRRNKRYKRY